MSEKIFSNNEELFKYYTETVDIRKIPEDPLKMTLMGCKCSISTTINIAEIRPYLVTTDDIPIIECPSYVMISLNLNYMLFKKNKKKFKFYKTLLKSAKDEIAKYTNKPQSINYEYVYNIKKNKIGRTGNITIMFKQNMLMFCCLKEEKRFRSEMKSQIQFTVFNGEKYYNIKRFTNGSIQIPHCLDIINFSDALIVLNKLIDYENTYYNKYSFICNNCTENNHSENNCTCILRKLTQFDEEKWFTIILMNYRFVLLHDWKIKLENLSDILNEERKKQINMRIEGEKIDNDKCDYSISDKLLDRNSQKLPYIYYKKEDIFITSIKYALSDVRLTIKFLLPELKRKKPFITLTISNNGKCNLQGTLPHISTETFYQYIIDIFSSNEKLFYRPSPTDDENEIIEQMKNIKTLKDISMDIDYVCVDEFNS